MHSQEYECLDCDKLFCLKNEARPAERNDIRCPVCGSANVVPLSKGLQDFLEERFGTPA